jgi:hypothetical protein
VALVGIQLTIKTNKIQKPTKEKKKGDDGSWIERERERERYVITLPGHLSLL